MIKHVYIFVFLLASFLLSNAQCPGCITNLSCTSNPAKPTICPDTLPDGTAMINYEEDVSFYLPAQFVDQGTGLNVTLNELHVTGVSGMPYGLQFESSSATNIFYPSSNPPTTEYGCARFCGIPLIPGDYIITVYVTAYVTVLGINQIEYDVFDLPIRINPNPTSNASFTISNPVGCTPLTTDFIVNYPSGGNTNYSYAWDFGNGNTSSLEVPSAQIYSNPGVYYVSCETQVDTLDYTISSVTVLTSDCSDIGFEPDYYIKIFDGTTEVYNNSSSYASNQPTVTFNFPPIILNDNTYSIEVWDNDDLLGGGQPGDDECGTVTFNGHTQGAYTLIDGSLIVSFSVDHAVLTFSDTDSVVVYPSPQISVFEVIPNDTICDNDSMFIRVVGGETWQWYINGSGIQSAIDSIYVPMIDGAYYVAASNSYGCMVNSANMYIAFLASPPYPNFYQNGNTLFCTNAGFQYQWYFNDQPISGATSQTCTIDSTGYYIVELIASNGCATPSVPYYAILQSISEYDVAEIKFYPNPVRNIIYFDTDFNQQYYRIIDVVGNVVQEGRIEVNSINVGDLNSAVYFIQILCPQKQHQATFVKE